MKERQLEPFGTKDKLQQCPQCGHEHGVILMCMYFSYDKEELWGGDLRDVAGFCGCHYFREQLEQQERAEAGLDLPPEGGC